MLRAAVYHHDGGRTPSRRSLSRRLFGETPSGWGFIMPAVVIILGLSILPMLWSLLLSLENADLITPPKWIGLQNYQKIVADPKFGAAVAHTLIYTALFVPLSIVGGIAIAMMLNRRIRFIGVYRTLVFVPYIVSATAQGVLFSFIFDSHFGVVNAILHHLGIPAQGFFADSHQALYLLVLIGLWSGLGFCVVVYLAALQDIPKELIEAAATDGAGRWVTFRHVVLPALSPVTVFLLVWQTLQSLQVFDIVFVTTRGGPLESTTVIVYFVWNEAFQLFNAGYGAAAAYIVVFCVLVVSLAVRFFRRPQRTAKEAPQA